jgi:hypothetical protein
LAGKILQFWNVEPFEDLSRVPAFSTTPDWIPAVTASQSVLMHSSRKKKLAGRKFSEEKLSP